MATTANTNAHFSSQYRLNAKPDYSDMVSFNQSHNVQLTREKDLSRYRTGYSDKNNIYDNSRTVPPTNYFGKRFIRDYDRTPHYRPAGMDYVNSTIQSGQAFTKTFVRNFNVI